MSDAEKEAIPEHVKKAAREMGQRAFQQRLKEIQMSPYDAKLYEQFYQGVSKQVLVHPFIQILLCCDAAVS